MGDIILDVPKLDGARMVGAIELSEQGNEAIASLFPLNLPGNVVALRACIDASARTSGVFTIAGVAYGFDRAVKANREWERILGGRTFHMTDLNSRQNKFAGISDSDVHQIMVGAVAIVRNYASYLFAVSCDASLIADSLPKVSSPDPDSRAMLDAFRSTYGFMCHVGMFALGELVNKAEISGPRQISYVFERGDVGQKGLRRYLEHVETSEHADLFLDGYCLASHTVSGKDNIEGVFHSADLVAWEWSKHVDNLHRHPSVPMRKSLSAILGDGTETRLDKYGLTLSAGTHFFFRHYEPERLRGSIGYFSDVLTATSADAVDVAFNRWKATR